MASTPKAKLAGENFFTRLRDKWAFKIGRIEQLIITPCINNNPLIFVLAFVSGIPEAIVTLNTHDCSDNEWDKGKQLYEPVKPRGGRKHGRKGTPTHGPGEKLPGTGPPCRGLCQAGFKFGDFVQKVGAKLLIVDAALDLGINWMSNTLEWNGCTPPPPIAGMGLIASRAYGDFGRAIDLDCVNQPGNQGVLFGIGGFICSVPAGNLETNCNANFIPLPPMPFTNAISCELALFRSGGTALLMDQQSGAALTSTGGQNWARASTNLIAPASIFGRPVLIEPTVAGHGGQIDQNASTVVVSGQTEGMLFANGNPDPCSNLPVTGTRPIRR